MKNNEKQPVSWILDPTHSEIHFRVRHMMISWVGGYFQNFTGEFQFNEPDFQDLQIKLNIPVDNISTGNANRDEHLRSIDFFDSGNFPEINFRSEGKPWKDLSGNFWLRGELNIHGQSRMIQLKIDSFGSGIDPWGNERFGFSVSAEIKRSDFGIGWNTTLDRGGVLIGEDVQIRAELQLISKNKQVQR